MAPHTKNMLSGPASRNPPRSWLHQNKRVQPHQCHASRIRAEHSSPESPKGGPKTSKRHSPSVVSIEAFSGIHIVYKSQRKKKEALVISRTACGELFWPSQNFVESSNPDGTLVEPSWNPRGTLVEPYLGAAQTTPEPIWAQTPKLSAVGEKHAPSKGYLMIEIWQLKKRTPVCLTPVFCEADDSRNPTPGHDKMRQSSSVSALSFCAFSTCGLSRRCWWCWFLVEKPVIK